MEWMNRMTDTLNYMEKNMEGQIDIQEIARVACSSTFHFQRMFHMLTGMTVAEYIRKRKLTLAAQELAISSNVRVLDVALKYGYESPESFAKAFRRVQGLTPSAAREPGVKLKAFPRISFHISLKGDKDMDYRIVARESFKVVGRSIQVSIKDGENYRRIPKFWQECCDDGSCEKLCSISDKKELLGICMDMEHEKEQMKYMIAVEGVKNVEKEAEEFVIREIPSATWAIFTSVGPIPGTIQEVWKRIFQEWFPSTGYEHAEAPELEVYPQGNPLADDYYCEIWIPIIKK